MVVEYLFSLQVALDVLDDYRIADLIEKVAYNALPAAVTPDFKGHQYLQQQNQVLVTKAKRDWYNNGDDASLFGLEPHFGCCTANLHQGWPKFMKNMFRAIDGGLSCFVYAPCHISFTAPSGRTVSVYEETDYPFRSEVKFTFKTQGDEKFIFRVRVPEWCEEAVVTYKEKTMVLSGGFHSLNEVWRNKDSITLTLPMKIRVSFWDGGAMAVEHGPLVFSLAMGEEWTQSGGYPYFPDWEVHPTTPWNYALSLDTSQWTVETRPVGKQPFSKSSSPLVIKAKAKRADAWMLKDNSAGKIPQSPLAFTGTQEETVALIPYGAAKLRITQFPWYRGGRC
jgi:hypothetical protein